MQNTPSIKLIQFSSMLKKELETRQFIVLNTFSTRKGILNQGIKNAYKDKLNDESQTFTSSTYVFSSKP